MRIAITSQNFRTITGHAGKTRRFLVLEGAPGGEPHEAERLDLDKEMAFHEFRGQGEHPVDSCEVLITQSCGFGFRQKLAGRGVRVLVTGESDPFKAARAFLNGEPLPAPEAEPEHQHAHGHGHAHAHGHGHGGCGCSGHGGKGDGD
jgi:predicted Fe-Mo cluster-binding NifX family protein